MSDEASDRQNQVAMLHLPMRRRGCDRAGDDPALVGLDAWARACVSSPDRTSEASWSTGQMAPARPDRRSAMVTVATPAGPEVFESGLEVSAAGKLPGGRSCAASG